MSMRVGCQSITIRKKNNNSTKPSQKLLQSFLLMIFFPSEMQCPVDRELIDKTRIFPDKSMERKVLSLNVRCHYSQQQNCNNNNNNNNNNINSYPVCEWSGELRSLDSHVSVCRYKTVRCTNHKVWIKPLIYRALFNIFNTFNMSVYQGLLGVGHERLAMKVFSSSSSDSHYFFLKKNSDK